MTETHLPRSELPASLAHLGSLIGDPIRAAILSHLADGSCRPAGELATLAGVSQQAVSAHLGLLVEGGLLRVAPQGRYRFFSLASGEVAEIIEALVGWLDMPRRAIVHPRQLREARLCYDHLAGRLGVAVFERMSALGFLMFGPEGPALADSGRSWCQRVGIRLDRPSGSRRPPLRLCLDWTERRHHMGGHFGAAMTDHMLETGLIDRISKGRSLLLTAKGATFLRRELDLSPTAGAGCAHEEG